jgi:UDP-N-acetylmuramoyl-L-alanyl-D-glutamate--2,6-diaminopimelate ligase
MKLADLLPRLDPGGYDQLRIEGDPDLEVSGITHDSRQVRPGWIFAALPGERHHGIEFLAEAIAGGAVAVLGDRSSAPAGDAGVAWICSGRPRRHMALAAWALADDPQDRLRIIGVTGTNGKSTVVNLISTILHRAGTPCGTFGTLGYDVLDEVLPASRTTPEASDLAPMLARLVAAGGRAAAMEVSSHALAQDRVTGLSFDVAVWTNLTRDHLDYHHDMESYFQVKRLLFTTPLLERGTRVLPAGEDWAERLLSETLPYAGRVLDLTWGIGRGVVRADDVRLGLNGTSFDLRLPDGAATVTTRLIGRHNLRNSLAAAAAAHALGMDPAAIADGLGAARPVAGRLERVETRLRSPVLVDFAHTPDGLRTLLISLGELTDRRLIVVFGAGGDRDRGKREPMGRAVGELADVAIVTSDNPRTEDPAEIAETVAAGVRAAGGEPLVELDRREAVARALRIAEGLETVEQLGGDDAGRNLVVVAGKGHEQTQTIGARVIELDDRALVRELAEELQ